MPYLEKCSSRRISISHQERLVISLRYLGMSQQWLSFSFRNGRNIVSMVIEEACDALVKELSSLYLCPPQNETRWKGISYAFDNL